MTRRRSARALGVFGVAIVLAGAAVSAEPGATERAAAAQRAGISALEAGRFEEAAGLFEEAAALYRGASQRVDLLDALLQLSQAELALGAIGAAEATLREATPLAEQGGTDAQRAAAIAAAGSLRLARDEREEAAQLLSEAATLAKRAGETSVAAAAELNLGIVEALRGKGAQALRMLDAAALAAAESEGGSELAARALANAARILTGAGDPERALALAERAEAAAAGLGPTHARAAVLVHLAVTQRELARARPALAAELRRRSHRVLLAAREAARESGDLRSEVDALGYLGALYESEGRHEEGLALTRQALLAMGTLDAPRSAYRWEWQRARLLAALGREPEAIQAYERAIASRGAVEAARFEAPRTESAPASGGVSAHLGLVDLLLRRAPRSGDAGEALALRRRAREVVELSKADELRDYFRDDCVDAFRSRVKDVARVSESAAIAHPIALEDRLEILVSLPGDAIRQFTVPVRRQALEGAIREYRTLLLRRTTSEYRVPARRLYEWLVAPFADELRQRGIDTLVFVPDRETRAVPMAALHDGRRFLIERFALAVTPGVELTDPRPIDPAQLVVLLGGVSRSVDGLPALTHVRDELAAVADVLGGETLLDEGFRRDALARSLAQPRFGIVHIATHGEFTAEFDASYLVAWDGRVSGDELADRIGLFRFRDRPLELLSLSACEMGRGGDRAALGLLGLAVKAGARSALGSLWKVNDESTALLIGDFYRELARTGVSRAEALRRAQRGLIAHPAFGHPLYWSGFLLISSWL